MPIRLSFTCGASSSKYVDDTVKPYELLTPVTATAADIHHLDLGVNTLAPLEHNVETSVTKESSFHSSNKSTAPTTCSFSSNGSLDLDGSSSPGTIKSSRSVTFRDKTNRAPKSVNALPFPSISNSTSTLSEVVEIGGSINNITTNTIAIATTSSSSGSFQSYSLLEKYGISPNPVKFAFLYGQRNISEIRGSESDEEAKAGKGDSNAAPATSSMFTKEEIESITPLQISTYLSIDEREKIGTKVLCAKLKKGYTFSDYGGNDTCETCSMPKLINTTESNNNKETIMETCAVCGVCPVLKKKVLKRILNGCGCQVQEEQAFP